MTLNFSTASSTRERAPEARGIDQRVALAIALERHHDGVPGGTGLIERHQTIFAQQPVDQGALAHVGTSDDRHPDAVELRPVGRVGLEARQRRLEERHHPLIVSRRDRMRLAEAETMEIRDSHVEVESLRLVDGQDHGFAAAARQLRHELVLGRKTRPSIDQYDQTVRLGNRSFGLRDHEALDLVGVGVLHQPTGIDHDAGDLRSARETVLPVAREAGEVRDQGVPRPRHRVEQRRLAYVGSTDQCDYGQHFGTATAAERRPASSGLGAATASRALSPARRPTARCERRGSRDTRPACPSP